MTTNRAGSLDEAFKTRIHYKIYYPPLTKQQTLEIWQINLQRLHKIEEDEQRQWNQSQPDDDFNTTAISFPRALHKPMDIPDEEILRFAHRQFDMARPGTIGWNGRQIRNAFQVAKSLAYADAAAEFERLEAEALSLAAQSGNSPQLDRIIVHAPRLQVEHFKAVHEITEEFDQYMEEVFSGMNDGQLAREKEERADHFLQPVPVVGIRPTSGTGWRGLKQQHSSSSHSHLSRRYEEETTCFESTLPMSRPHSRGAVGGGVGGELGGGLGMGVGMAPRSPRMGADNVGGENWVNGPSIAIPLGASGGGINVGLGVRVGMSSQQQQQHQQQRQYQETRGGRMPPSSPMLQATGGGYYPDERLGLNDRGQGMDNGPLPGQVQMPQRQGQIGNVPRTMGQGQFYSSGVGDGGHVGHGDGNLNYTFGNGTGGGGGFLHRDESEASRPVSPGVSLSAGIHSSSVSSHGGGRVGGLNQVPRGLVSQEGSYSVAVGPGGGMME